MMKGTDLEVKVEEGAEKDSQDQGVPLFTFTGSSWTVCRMVLKNLFFSLVTLSIYRFWGRVNVRKYIWGNIYFDGKPFIYTGNGMELLKNFMIASVLIFIPLFFVNDWLDDLVFSQDYIYVGYGLKILLFVGLFWLASFSLYSARRFRLFRTRWHHFRGHQGGSAIRYAWLSLRYGVLVLFSLGLLKPVYDMKLWTYEAGYKQFGSLRIAFEETTASLFGALFVSSILFAAAVAVGFMVQFGVTNDVIANLSFSEILNILSGNVSFLELISDYGIIFIISAVTFSYYQACKLEVKINNSYIGKHRLRCQINKMQFLKLLFTNALLFVFTLGLASPVARVRLLRFLSHSIYLSEKIDYLSHSQGQDAALVRSEDLPDGFDLGIL